MPIARSISCLLAITALDGITDYRASHIQPLDEAVPEFELGIE